MLTHMHTCAHTYIHSYYLTLLQGPPGLILGTLEQSRAEHLLLTQAGRGCYGTHVSDQNNPHLRAWRPYLRCLKNLINVRGQVSVL